MDIKQNERLKKRRKRDVKAGLCILGDHRPAVPGKTLCSTCIERRRKNRLETIQRGLCVACKKPNNNGQVKCEVCKFRHLAYRFGMSPEGCLRLFEACGFSCNVCRNSCDLVIDHDHKTGKVRGVLCKQCNISLGGAKDSIDTLKGLIEYLQVPPANEILKGDTPVKLGRGRRPRAIIRTGD